MKPDLGEAAFKADYRRLLEELRPIGYGETFDVEPWPKYRDRARKLLPNFPDDAIQHWLHRHYSDAISDWGWLNLPSLRVMEERWPTARILAEVVDWPDHGLVAKWRDQLYSDAGFRGSFLGVTMLETGTWPAPPMVIPNGLGLRRPDDLPLGKPVQLMEGYHRLGYLHALHNGAGRPPLTAHRVLVVNADPESLLDYWPSNR